MSNALLSSLPQRVTVVEVGPRDGLQNEAGVVTTADKIRFIDLLSAAGFPVIEATSFVSPKAVPQLADASEVMAGITKRPGTRYSALVPNAKGMERALAAGLREVAVFTGASETFVQHNINTTIAGSIENFRPVVEMARGAGVRVRGYVSTAFGCPYEGAVAPDAVLRVCEMLLDLGVDELSIGDTIGVGTPNQVVELTALLTSRVPLDRLAMHFHDTRGTALANVLAALQMGISIFDSSTGGLGGCPYAPGASGNLATEDLLYLLHGLGIETGVNLDAVVEASRFLAGVRGKAPASRYYAAATAV
ncbi:MAG: Hydroxymethylglutaryl-CoA lyase [Ktedonobacterales bacterium]|jgi:isopropylmalate/homocitrate/citramalate synthase|nr:MAG: Hydroxymethylglutaryl-CoA lyase [Ktedonobacterales bacterium]